MVFSQQRDAIGQEKSRVMKNELLFRFKTKNVLWKVASKFWFAKQNYILHIIQGLQTSQMHSAKES